MFIATKELSQRDWITVASRVAEFLSANGETTARIEYDFILERDLKGLRQPPAITIQLEDLVTRIEQDLISGDIEYASGTNCEISFPASGIRMTLCNDCDIHFEASNESALSDLSAFLATKEIETFEPKPISRPTVGIAKGAPLDRFFSFFRKANRARGAMNIVSSTEIKPSQFERFVLFAVYASATVIGIALLWRAYIEAVLILAAGCAYFLFVGRQSLSISDLGITRSRGLRQTMWPRTSIEKIQVEVAFGNQSGLLYVPQEIQISIQQAGSIQKLCSSYTYGTVSIAGAIRGLKRCFSNNIEWRFRYCPEGIVSTDLSDADTYFERVRMSLQRRLRLDLWVGAGFFILASVIAIQAKSLYAAGFLGSIILAVFALKIGLLMQAKRTLIRPSDLIGGS